MKTESATPRTDAAEIPVGEFDSKYYCAVPADFARTLEREQVAIRQAHDAAVLAFRRIDEQNTVLRAALEDIANEDYRGNRSNASIKAHTALCSVKGHADGSVTLNGPWTVSGKAAEPGTHPMP